MKLWLHPVIPLPWLKMLKRAVKCRICKTRNEIDERRSENTSLNTPLQTKNAIRTRPKISLLINSDGTNRSIKLILDEDNASKLLQLSTNKFF